MNFRPPARANPPIPDAAEAARNVHTRIPDAPIPAYGSIKDDPKSKDSGSSQQTWTFTYDGRSGADGSVEGFTPIELQRGKPKPLSIQLINDTTLRGTSRFDPNEATDYLIGMHTYDDTQFIADPGVATVRIVAGEPGFPSSLLVKLEGEYPFLGDVTHITIGNMGSYQKWDLVAQVDVDNPDFSTFEVTYDPVGSTMDTPLVHDDLYELHFKVDVPPTEVKPNAAIRARVKYTAGKAEDIEFECDWRGEIELVADRVELQRVVFKPDSEKPFHETKVRLRAIAAVNGPPPRIPATYTVPVAEVVAGAYRTIALPALAQRVSLLTRYGSDPMDPGDAPLGQIFVSFATESGNAMGYVDAMSAREALFGAGLSIPAGAVDVLFVNLSPDPVDLGAVFHLAV